MLKLITADYQNLVHCQDLITLLDHYACDPMGGGKPLNKMVREQLCGALQKTPGAFSLLAYSGDAPVGLVNCFMGFSTFRCAPLVNIHDIVVHKNNRGQGIGQALLAEVENTARQRGCCRVALEVLENNHAAKRSYERFGFRRYQLDPAAGSAEFWQKEFEQ